jgi:hypothetical protein
MVFKKILNFFRPNWKKLFLLFVFEFLISFTLLSVGERLLSWQVYLLSPNIYYLESTINPMFVTQQDLSINGAVSNIISLAYFYFLSCLIIESRESLIKFFVNLVKKRRKE